MADFVLRVVEGNAAGTEVPVGDELLLGRGVDKPGNLGGDGTLSRRHARIVRGGGGELLLEDLGSHNGTLVNGATITAQVVLAVGDRIEMGETALELVRVEPVVPAPPVVASDPGRTRVSHRIVTPDPPPPAAPDAPTPTPQDQPTRLGEVPVEAVGSRDQATRLGEVPVEAVGSRDQATRLGEVPVEAVGSRDQATRLGEVPVEAVGSRDEATRLGEVPVEAVGSRDQATRLGEVPVEAVGSRDQATRLGEVPVEVAGSRDQPTRLGEVPAPAPTPAPAEPEAEAPRASWWRRLLRGSR